MSDIIIFGATSKIAHETARCFAREGADLLLIARNSAALAIVAEDLRARGAGKVETIVANLEVTESHAELFEKVSAMMPKIDVALLAYGFLNDQELCQKDFKNALHALNVNFLSVVSLLTPLANKMESEKSGTIAVIGSVAGDRGRQSNYIYGTAKGALDIFLQGLRNRLSPSGVGVLTIKPGFVDTPMTTDLPKNFLFAEAEKVGQDIYNAIQNKKDLIYTPWFWRIIMLVISLIPESIFKKLKL